MFRNILIAIDGSDLADKTQGLLATLVADTAPEDMRGTAFGLFNLTAGFAVLMASIIAGALWNIYGPKMTFLAGAAFTFLALAGLLIARAGAAKRDGDA